MVGTPLAGIAAISYVLPGAPVPLHTLAADGKLDSAEDVLREFGFEGVHISEAGADALAIEAVQRLIADHAIDPESIDVVCYAGALPSSHRVATGGVLEDFSYPVARLQYECGLLRATTVGIGQAGCTGLMAAVDLALGHLATHAEARRVLCVSSDVLRPEAKREIVLNVISDGACALLVERGGARNRILASRRVSKGYYWDATARTTEIIAAYFPTARTIIRDVLTGMALPASEIALVVPHNVSRRSWDILLPLAGLPADRLFADNIGPRGHVIAADNFINLKDAKDRGRLRDGDRALLFNFGFGAAWAAMVVEA